ncbi:single-stranded DNA-binding protein [Curtobacterium sp. VKM Ac-1395]|uniref:single-stranded DNA-binding protein n=1 Tax=Curtobacterium sp. VKM Ac-1395 TaxID=2783815 RepID=UPI00188CA398|nr:single-stranded DNA-binding protein [Curtobacterium sp. VKM Ac-1395]MBF4589987.1 single-stranded DNA-binding protein [Curtobacterium sp. VKM Ac-1395]
MNDTITVCGIVATEPRHLVTETGIAITSMRLASPSRRWDRANATWTNGPTNWFTVTAFRSLAANVHKSVKKGDRIIVTGRVRIRTWERDGRGGTSVEIDAEGIGQDLAWGISNWIKVPRHASEGSAAPGGGPSVDPKTGEVHEPHHDDPHDGDHEHVDEPRGDDQQHGPGSHGSVGGADDELPDPATAARAAAMVQGDAEHRDAA